MNGEIGEWNEEVPTYSPALGVGPEPVDPERIKRMAREMRDIHAAMEVLGRSLKVVVEDYRALRLAALGDEDSIVHACPTDTSGIMPCCGRSTMDVPLTEPIRMDPAVVTCRGALV